MRLKTHFLLLLLWVLMIPLLVLSQPIVDFTLSDSSCVGSQINVTNLTTGGSTFYWSFCSGNTINNPTGVNIGNPGGILSIPTYITLVNENINHYSFVSCPGIPGVIRFFHGSSFANNPTSWTNLGNFGILTNQMEGIQIKQDGGQWYGLVNNYNSIVRLNFGSLLSNTPTATTIGTYPAMVMGHGLGIYKEGNTWVGFVTCSTGQKLLRFNFGNSLANTPVMQDLGNLAGFISPTQLVLVIENNQKYLFICNGSSLCRIDFGSSLLNAPVGNNLGGFGILNSGCLTLIRDCDLTVGYFCNYVNPGILGKLNFAYGTTGPITGSLIGNIGNLNLPHSFSEIFRRYTICIRNKSGFSYFDTLYISPLHKFLNSFIHFFYSSVIFV